MKTIHKNKFSSIKICLIAAWLWLFYAVPIDNVIALEPLIRFQKQQHFTTPALNRIICLLGCIMLPIVFIMVLSWLPFGAAFDTTEGKIRGEDACEYSRIFKPIDVTLPMILHGK